jgi:predicted Na+-dependent transporter
MELQTGHFRDLGHRKRTVAWALGLQPILLPLLGFALTHFLMLPAHIRAGILLLAGVFGASGQVGWKGMPDWCVTPVWAGWLFSCST